ncbi:MAG: hypothetical protein ACO1N5_07820 [Noviherbaspirillum sp.]
MMREISGFFDKLYFTESVLGHACFEGERLRIPVSGIFLLAGHPLANEEYGPYEGEFVFDGVADSRRTVTEYIGDSRKPEGFKPSYEVVDDIPARESMGTKALQEFGFEGYQKSPSAWIDNWVVRARLFTFRVF